MLLLALALTLAPGQDGWRPLRVPGAWETRDGGLVDGVAWYRCAFRVPPDWADEEFLLELGAIDDCDTTFFNGVRVGGLGREVPYRSASAESRRYTVPSELLRPDATNVIGVRVFDGGGAGGIVAGRPRLSCALGWLELDGEWDWRPGDDPAWAAPRDGPELDALAARIAARVVRLDEVPSLPGARPLSMDGDPAHEMVGELVVYLGMQRTPIVVNERERSWRDALALPAEERAAEWQRRRARLGELLGTEDGARRSGAFELVGEAVALGAGVTARAVRWPVFHDVQGEGLLIEPATPTRASVVVLPDADTSPEEELGTERRSAVRLLAAAGCRVLVPRLVDRDTRFSGVADVGHNDLPHREWIQRQAYELGATMIGYEVQSVRSAIDALEAREPRPVGLFGYGEGGSIALHTAALDERIAATVVSGYFEDRGGLASQPIYRNVWRYLAEYGDAGVARLVASRALIVEAARGPEVDAIGSTPGTIRSPEIDAVRAEAARVRPAFTELGGTLRVFGDGSNRQALPETMRLFLGRLGVDNEAGREELARAHPVAQEAEAAQGRVVAGWVRHTQAKFERADVERAASLGGADATSAETWAATVPALRERFHAEVLGALPRSTSDPDPRARVAYVTDAFVGYEVVLDVWERSFAYGVLLVPRDLRTGERRPVVVCQHGLEGRPGDVVNPDVETRYYRSFGARLAERGFVVFAPQNPYLGGDRFRFLQRQANPIGATLFSIIVRQHEAILDWLGELPFVDPERIAFYGLSYGGKTAMRVPAVLDGYCLSICSADFNEWIRKNASVAYPWSYMFGGEYDMAEWNLGRTFGYAEMAALVAPRPFMVERGHHDSVGVDEWVAFEYARVRRFYARLGIPERTEIEFFDGGHVIRGEGTFRFLERHLRWPD